MLLRFSFDSVVTGAHARLEAHNLYSLALNSGPRQSTELDAWRCQKSTLKVNSGEITLQLRWCNETVTVTCFICNPTNRIFNFGHIATLGYKTVFKSTVSNCMTSTLYTTIAFNILKIRRFDIMDNCFFNKNGGGEIKRWSAIQIHVIILLKTTIVLLSFHVGIRSWNLKKRNAGVPHWQYLCGHRCSCLPAFFWNSDGYIFCSIVRLTVFIFLWDTRKIFCFKCIKDFFFNW
jgi:hypothetical protein